MLVRELMHENVRTCHPGDNLESVALTMWNDDCGAVPMVDEDGRAVGIVTDRDIAMAAALKHRPLWGILANEVKPGAPLYSCRAEDDIRAALHLMAEQRVRRLVVLSDDGRVAGIVSTKDLLDHAQPSSNDKVKVKGRGKVKALATDEALSTLREICRPNLMRVVA